MIRQGSEQQQAQTKDISSAKTGYQNALSQIMGQRNNTQLELAKLMDSLAKPGGVGYSFPVLKAYRRHVWGDQTRIDGTLTNVHLVSAVRAPVTDEDRARILASDN